MIRKIRQCFAEWRQLVRWRFLQRKAAGCAASFVHGRPPALMLFPCDSGSVIGSRGDEAMVYAILDDFLRRRPDGRIVVVTTSLSFADSPDGRRLRTDFAPRLAVLHTPGGLMNFLGLLLSERPAEVYALGVNCMDGHYSPFTSVNLLGVCDLATRLSIPSALTSFSWNEHPHAAVVRLPLRDAASADSGARSRILRAVHERGCTDTGCAVRARGRRGLQPAADDLGGSSDGAGAPCRRDTAGTVRPGL